MKEKGQNTEQILLDVVRTMRQHPEKYQGMRRSLREANSDEERVRQLLNYATSDRELASLVPVGTGETEQLAWTTVTVTTVFIPDSAY